MPRLGLNLWTMVALLFAAEIGSVLGIYGLITTNMPFFHEHDDPAAQEPAPAHLAPPGGLGAARFARRGHQPLPRRYVRDPAVRAVAQRSDGIARLQHHRPDRDGAHQPHLHRAGAAAVHRRRRDRRGLHQAHRRIPPRQQPRHRHHHRVHRRILRRGAGGQGGHRRRRRDRPFQRAERRAPRCWRCATGCSTKS